MEKVIVIVFLAAMRAQSRRFVKCPGMAGR